MNTNLSEMPGRRKRNYPLLLLSCLILTLACWNVWRAEEEFYGKDLWGDAAFAMVKSLRLPDISSYAWSQNDAASIGVIVLGMHRSGTSMLAGILATAYGYYTGEEDELIPPRYANAKGYYERFDIVRQNDRLIKAVREDLPPIRGNILFDTNGILGYGVYANHDQVIKDTEDPDLTSALNFLNNQNDGINSVGQHPTAPWIQKDPRMCITLGTWLPLLKHAPSVLITFRHPAEVGHSVATRDHKPMLIGLKSWIAYNAALIRNSMGLCRVVTKNSDLLQDPVKELRRIVHELSTRCDVLPPPIPDPDPSVVDDFIDVKMQGSRHKELTPCVDGKPYFNVTTSGLKPTSRKLYKQAMILYCDMETGIAFLPNYTGWPDDIENKFKDDESKD